jgi:hypothetical protein
MSDLAILGDELRSALARRVEVRRRRRRRLTATAVVALAASGFSAVALASGIAGDLPLDPTKWSIVGSGTVENGRGEYVHAERRADGSHSTFMVEHDAGLHAYEAFLLHEKTVAAAQESSPVPVQAEQGDLCTPAQLTRAETVALATLRAQFPPGASTDATKPAVDAALESAFAGSACRGLEYGGEQARLVYAGTMPASKLMPGVG